MYLFGVCVCVVCWLVRVDYVAGLFCFDRVLVGGAYLWFYCDLLALNACFVGY